MSGLKFYPQKDGSHLCESCLPPIIKADAPPMVYVSTDEFTGMVPIKYAECVDVT